MTDFKVGMYVVDSSGHIGKITQLYGELCSAEFIIKGIKGIYHNEHLQFLKRATVLDYIRTLDAEKMAMFLYDINHGNTTINFHDYPNQEHIKWLNQPLTDNLVKQLGGMEE